MPHLSRCASKGLKYPAFSFLLAGLLLTQACSENVKESAPGERLLAMDDLPKGIDLSIKAHPHEDNLLLDLVFDLTVTHPSGDRQAHYQITYPNVPRTSREALVLHAAQRKMYLVVPQEDHTWEDALSTSLDLTAFHLVRLEGAGEEASWGLEGAF